MKILFHGKDKGAALLTALICIFIASLISLSTISYICSFSRLAAQEKQRVAQYIENMNIQAVHSYDSH